MTLFTSLGPSPDCMKLTQVTKYQERTGHAREATFSVLQRSFSLGWGLHGKVARMPHQSKERGGTVCRGTHPRVDPGEIGLVALEETANGLHEHAVGGSGVKTAGCFERQDPL